MLHPIIEEKLMSTVTHKFDSEEIKGKGHDELRVLLTNRNGSYLSIPSTKRSKYDGFFWRHRKTYRIVEDIKVLQAAAPRNIVNEFSEIKREFSSYSETFFVPRNKNGFHYLLDNKKAITLDFDIKESYDNRVWGQNYELKETNSMQILNFSKKNDSREPKGDEFEISIAVKSDGKAIPIKEWVNKHYETDAKRKSEPTERHVYRAFEINAKRFALGIGENEEDAIKNANEIFDNYEKLRAQHEEETKSMLGWRLDDENISMAFRCAIASLDSLRTDEGILAGLPWFFQIWGRDEAISLKALMLQKEYAYSKKILESMLEFKDSFGRLKNILLRGESEIGSADATGWVIQRFSDLLLLLEKDGQLQLYFTKSEIEKLVSILEGIIDEVTKNKAREGLVTNAALETWMDTKYEEDTRGGIRIEIQALQIACYKALFRLTNKKFYSALAENGIKNVRKKLFNGSYLNDGVDDKTIRPNIFIAYYLVPELLERSDWSSTFDNALKALWNGWGGLSTIDKSSTLYCSESSGQDTRSYHRGDSWFWINNLAAFCLSRFDYKKYKSQIDKILDASTEEILFHGAIGHHSELSSSEELRSEGCFAQAWSAAMYIELVHELFVR